MLFILYVYNYKISQSLADRQRQCFPSFYSAWCHISVCLNVYSLECVQMCIIESPSLYVSFTEAHEYTQRNMTLNLTQVRRMKEWSRRVYDFNVFARMCSPPFEIWKRTHANVSFLCKLCGVSILSDSYEQINTSHHSIAGRCMNAIGCECAFIRYILLATWKNSLYLIQWLI